MTGHADTIREPCDGCEVCELAAELADERIRAQKRERWFESVIAFWRAEEKDWINERAALERRVQELEAALRSIMGELGVPQPDYPQPVANAYAIARDALAGSEATPEKPQ